jgi:hypothetical protein
MSERHDALRKVIRKANDDPNSFVVLPGGSFRVEYRPALPTFTRWPQCVEFLRRGRASLVARSSDELIALEPMP